MKIHFQKDRDSKPAAMRIKIVGVGGGGCNALSTLAENWVSRPELLGIDSDAQTMQTCPDLQCLQIGSSTMRGLSAGGDPDAGRRAAEQAREEISALFKDVNLTILVAGLGGGTGTGAAPIIAAAAADAGSLVLGFAIMPFEFEGPQSMERAAQGLIKLKEIADAVIIFPNENILGLIDTSTSMTTSFKLADRLIGDCIRALWELFNNTGIINLDFADFQSLVMHSDKTCSMAYVQHTGASRAVDTVRDILLAPQFHAGERLKSASALLVGIIGGHDLTLIEVQTILGEINSHAGENTRIIMGTALDTDCESTLGLTLFAAEPKAKPQPSVSGTENKIIEPVVRPAVSAVADKGKKKTKHKAKQIPLDLEAKGRGRFSEVSPTVHEGANLDIPTYVRRGIKLPR